MSSSMEWSYDFCLACDRQTDGSVYCGEACRLAEYEKANAGSEASSPTSQRTPGSWPSQSRSSKQLYLPPAYDFSAYKIRSSQSSRPQSSPMPTTRPVLTPSSSQSSLFSMQSSSSSTSEQAAQLSDETKRELRGYASSFDQSRYHRRQSAH